MMRVWEIGDRISEGGGRNRSGDGDQMVKRRNGEKRRE